MPSVQRAHETVKTRNIKVLTISIDAGGVKDVAPFMREHGYTMPVLLDPKMRAFSDFGLVGTPGTFIVNRDGKIVAKSVGPVNFDNPAFRSYVEKLATNR
jgi:cytochrome c biogenesis protein CcmG/thiol:disulfide interchange protein DsbE